MTEPQERETPPRYISRANLVLVRSHLQDAMQAGASGAVLTAIVAAIRELDR
jgi:hypothetical protein